MSQHYTLKPLTVAMLIISVGGVGYAKNSLALDAITTALSTASTPSTASSADGFVLRDIRVEGLVRMLPAEVTNEIAFTSGDTVTQKMVAESVKAVYASGRFDNVSVRQTGNILIYTVIERPKIVGIDFKGNKKLKEEDLKKGAKSVDLEVGKVFRPDMVTQYTNEIELAYASQGYYDAKVTLEQTARPNNQVDLVFNIEEGKPSKVIKINVVGNKALSDNDIKRIFLLKEKGWVPLFGKDGTYSKEKLNASLDALKTAYQNKGYLNIKVLNSQTNVGTDNKQVFVDVTVDEGQQYRFSGASFVGDVIYPDSELKELLKFKSGDMYSQQKVVETQTLLSRKYANGGYYLVQIRPIPKVDEDNHTVNINYFVNSGKQIQVRRINFTGNTNTSEKVLRQNLRQMESALASQEKLELSKTRLMRTGFFKTVDYTIAPVEGVPDQIDVNFKVEEQQTGSTSFTVGFSQDAGVTYQFGLNQDNFMGTGRNVGVQFERSQTLDNYNLSVTNPYFTIDGVTQGYNLYYRKTKADSRNISTYLLDTAGASYSLGYPLNENENLGASVAVDQTTVRGNETLTASQKQYLAEQGHKGRVNIIQQTGSDIGAIKDYANKQYDAIYQEDYNAKFLDYKLNLNWSYNSLDRPVFPRSGQKLGLSLASTIPGSDLDYQKVIASSDLYFKLSDSFTYRLYGKVGYGRNLPFFQNFYAGGIGSIRGYKTRTLGPKEGSGGYFPAKYSVDGGSLPPYYYCGQDVEADGSAKCTNKDLYLNKWESYADPYPNPIGGSAQIQFGTELALPMPFKGEWTEKMRPVLFIDGGNVFKDFESIDSKEFRYSYGLGLTWMTFVGPISVQYARPFNNKSGDELKRLDFSIGMMF